MDIPKHHKKDSICATRLPYREGRIPKAVKVYTVNNESKYLLVQGVPSVGASSNLLQLFSKFGDVEEHHALDEYPCEDKYTEVYLFKYRKIQSARFAKRKLDDYSFFGGTLHVCYAPEHESVEETREKLRDRQRVVAYKIRQHTQPVKPVTASSRHPSLTDSSTKNIADTRGIKETPNNIASLPPLHHPPPPPPPPCQRPLHKPSSTHHFSPKQHYPPPRPPPNQQPHPQQQPHPVSYCFPPQSITHTKAPSALHQRGPPHNPLAVNKTPTSSRTEKHDEDESVDKAEEWHPETFKIPLPPRQCSEMSKTFQRKTRTEFSRVPSAHATLPVGFDGRLNPQVTHPNLSSDQTRNFHEIGSTHTPIVIVKDYKTSRPVPKFIPRQAIKRKNSEQHNDACPPSAKVTKQSKRDQELRQNAFKLGKVQGPENIEQKKEPVKIDAAIDKSMRTTILSIRSKISQVISDNVRKTC